MSTLVRLSILLVAAVCTLFFVSYFRPVTNKAKSPFSRLHVPFRPDNGRLSEDAIPALIGFYTDMGRFPSSAEGWSALFKAPEGLTQSERWIGPYLRSVDSHYQPIRLDGFLGVPQQKYQVVHSNHTALIHIQGIADEKFTWPGIWISVSPFDEQRVKLSQDELALKHRIEAILIPAIEKYSASTGVYPETFRELTRGFQNERGQEFGPCLSTQDVSTLSHPSGKYAYATVRSGGKSKGFVFRFFGDRHVIPLPEWVMPNFDLFDKHNDIAFGVVDIDNQRRCWFVAKGHLSFPET